DAAVALAGAVVVDEARAPLAAQCRVVATRDQGRVLQGDRCLVVVAVQRPGLDLATGTFAAVQQPMKRMQAMVAPRADVAERRFETVARNGFHAGQPVTARSPSRPRQ